MSILHTHCQVPSFSDRVPMNEITHTFISISCANSPLLRTQFDPTILQCLTDLCSYENAERTSSGLVAMDEVVLLALALLLSVRSTSTNSSRTVATCSIFLRLSLAGVNDAISIFSSIGTPVDSRALASPYELVRLRIERPAAWPRAGGM